MKYFIKFAIISVIIGFILVTIAERGTHKSNFISKHPTPDELKKQIQYLQEISQEQEIKRSLDSAYPFDHSKIPDGQ